jgi:uncharacterized membrane protein YphA (DoxX/SURF4 family)
MRWTLRVLRVVLGLVFVYAAYTKLKQPWLLFALSIDSYRVLPEWAVLTVARTLPWAELLLGALLLAGYRLRIVSTAAALLLVGFFAMMVRAHVAGMGIDCGCFGVGESLGPKTLVRDGILLAASAALCICAHVGDRLRSRQMS